MVARGTTDPRNAAGEVEDANLPFLRAPARRLRRSLEKRESPSSTPPGDPRLKLHEKGTLLRRIPPPPPFCTLEYEPIHQTDSQPSREQLPPCPLFAVVNIKNTMTLHEGTSTLPIPLVPPCAAPLHARCSLSSSFPFQGEVGVRHFKLTGRISLWMATSYCHCVVCCLCPPSPRGPLELHTAQTVHERRKI